MVKKFLSLSFLVVFILASFVNVGSASAAAGCGSTYTVQAGDTLYSIAAKCGTTMYAIRQVNPFIVNWVYTGQVLTMPGTSVTPVYTGSFFYYKVVAGDTLRLLAARYGTTATAIANLNGIYSTSWIYIGQTLKIPGSGTYVVPVNPNPAPYSIGLYYVQAGDTLRSLAYRWSVGIYDILAVNPQITNANLIYVGMTLNIPGQPNAPANSNPQYYTVVAGDTLRIIADRFGTSVYSLILLNPQLWNPNLIYVGSSIRVQ